MAARKPCSSRAWQASYSARVMAEAALRGRHLREDESGGREAGDDGPEAAQELCSRACSIRASRSADTAALSIWGLPPEMLKRDLKQRIGGELRRAAFGHVGHARGLARISRRVRMPPARWVATWGRCDELRCLSPSSVYVLVQFAVGTWVSRRMASEADYILAGRRLGVGLVTFSVFATYFGAEAIVASGGAVYEKGLAGALVDPVGYAGRHHHRRPLLRAGLVVARAHHLRRPVPPALLAGRGAAGGRRAAAGLGHLGGRPGARLRPGA